MAAPVRRLRVSSGVAPLMTSEELLPTFAGNSDDVLAVRRGRDLRRRN